MKSHAPVLEAPSPGRSGTARVGWHLLGPRAATVGFVGVLVLLAGFVAASGFTVHHHADAIVDQYELSRGIETVRRAALDDGLLAGVGGESRDAGGMRLARSGREFSIAVSSLRTLLEPADQPVLDDLVIHHDEVIRAAAVVLEAEGRPGVVGPARQRFRDAAMELRTGLDRLAADYRFDFDTAVAELEETDRRTIFTAPMVLALCLGAMSLFGLKLRHYRRRVEHQTLHDTLTGLPNRQLLHDRANQAITIARRTGASTALLLIDLDRFKEINDTLGHNYGDLVLSEIGPRLHQRLRDSDTVARLGGDEFGVLLTNLAGPESAVRVAEELAAALREPFRAGDLTFDLEGSIGVAVAPDHATNSEELVQRADIAMYLAKASHSSVALYRSEADRHSPEKLALLGELRDAIDGGQLALYYQSKHAVPDGWVCGAEALIRWIHPIRGLIPPDDFIPLAEHTSLIEPLTTWVIEEAARQVQLWAAAGLHLSVAVNVSARSLSDARFPTQLLAIVDAAGIDPSAIELEVTETSILREPERARSVLAALSELGFSISIDDFGSGYTSLAYLRTLPVDVLKIDRMFVSNMTNVPNDAVIVRSVVELGHNLGLDVIAEGVEDDATCRALAEMGCLTAQGYFWSRPIPAAEFLPWAMSRPEPVIPEG